MIVEYPLGITKRGKKTLQGIWENEMHAHARVSFPEMAHGFFHSQWVHPEMLPGL
jgi:hypothetical protein